MLKAILPENLQKSCRNLKAAPMKALRRNNRLAYRFIRNFYISARDKAPSDNFPPQAMGLR